MRIDLGRGHYTEWHPGVTEDTMVPVVTDDGVMPRSWGSLVAHSHGEILRQLPAARTAAAQRTESVRHILDHYQPTDLWGGSWDDVRKNFLWNHPDNRAFVEDVRRHGVQRPIPIDYESDPPRVMNGHRRLLAAERAGVQRVPTRQHEGWLDPDDPDPFGHEGMRRTAEGDYRMEHSAPGPDDAPMHDITGNGIYPADVYDNPHYYGLGQSGDDDYDEATYESWHHIRRVRGNPEKKVRIYRALPADYAHEGFHTGDWVSPSKTYARMHARETDPKNDWPVISTMVPAKHLHTDGNDFNEWGYNGPEKPYASVAHKGGYNQEIRERADGTIGRVKRRAPQDPAKEMWGSHVIKPSPEDYEALTDWATPNHEIAKRLLSKIDPAEVTWHHDEGADPFHAESAANKKAKSIHPPGAHEPGTAPLLAVTLHTKNGKTVNQMGIHPHVDYGDQPHGFDNWFKQITFPGIKHAIPKTAEVRYVNTEGSQVDLSGMMVAFAPPAHIVEHVVQEDGEPPQQLHVTLLYLGHDEDYSDKELAKLPQLVRQWAKTQRPLKARTQGAGTFVNEGEHVLWASVDIPGGTRVHDSLVDFLRGHGLAIEEDHGWIPHMTLRYDRWHVRFLPKIQPMDWTIRDVWFCTGDRWESFPLGRR